MHLSLADTLGNAKQSTEALAHYRTAARVAPANGDARVGLWAASLEVSAAVESMSSRSVVRRDRLSSQRRVVTTTSSTVPSLLEVSAWRQVM